MCTNWTRSHKSAINLMISTFTYVFLWFLPSFSVHELGQWLLPGAMPWNTSRCSRRMARRTRQGGSTTWSNTTVPGTWPWPWLDDDIHIWYMYIYICTYIYIQYMYIYIYTVHVYIYIHWLYIYTHVYTVCIYVYILCIYGGFHKWL